MDGGTTETTTNLNPLPGLTTLAELPFEIRNSAIEGNGGFATKRIANGDLVAEYVGERIPKEESQRRQEDGNPFIFTLDETEDIDGDVSWNPARFINHSCNPNCEAIFDEGRILIYARRDIEPGDELTFNYGYGIEEYADFPCRCGTAECVGFMVAEDHFDLVRARRDEAARVQPSTAAKSSETGDPIT